VIRVGIRRRCRPPGPLAGGRADIPATAILFAVWIPIAGAVNIFHPMIHPFHEEVTDQFFFYFTSFALLIQSFLRNLKIASAFGGGTTSFPTGLGIVILPVC
jgi:hypothetical protein